MQAGDAQEPNWHVVHLDQRHAEAATKAIAKAGYEFYDPQMLVWKSLRRSALSAKQRRSLSALRRPVLRPLFGGYKFIRFSLTNGLWHKLFELFGINGMIVNRNLPYPVSQQVIDALKGLEVAGAIPSDLPVKTLLFAIGERVRISDGPFRGFDGTVLELDESRQRVLLEIIFLNGARKVPFDASMLSVSR